MSVLHPNETKLAHSSANRLVILPLRTAADPHTCLLQMKLAVSVYHPVHSALAWACPISPNLKAQIVCELAYAFPVNTKTLHLHTGQGLHAGEWSCTACKDNIWRSTNDAHHYKKGILHPSGKTPLFFYCLKEPGTLTHPNFLKFCTVKYKGNAIVYAKYYGLMCS